MTADRSWLTHFDAFTPFHWTTLSVCIAIFIAWCWAGRRLLAQDRLDGGGRERRFRFTLAWAFLAWQAFATAWRLLPGQFDFNESLPLHMCRIVGWATPLAMLTMHWRLRAVVFFWGLGLSTQGLFTPMWHDGLASVAFWLYWVGHVIIIGGALYDLTVHAYRPGWRDLGFASLAGVVLCVGIALFNARCGTNYCYLGKGDYEGTSIVDVLGDWPARPAAIIGGALVIFLLMFGVSRAAQAVAGRRRASAA